MPYIMGDGIQAIVIGRNVYVGGGCGQNAMTVMVYSLETGTWRTLPPYENESFGMAALNDKLVLVCGRGMSTDKVSNVLAVWDEQSQTWTHPFPVIPTARDSPSVISYHNWLVVAGGINANGTACNIVEILDTDSGQWYNVGSPLPNRYSSLSDSMVVNGNMWYLLGGCYFQRVNKPVFCVCLDQLIPDAVSQPAGAVSPSTGSPWQTLTEMPLKGSTALILNGALLTVGGFGSSAIHLYQPSSWRWVKVGELPDQRRQCACTVLPSGEIFVAGGQCGLSLTNSVYIATHVSK